MKNSMTNKMTMDVETIALRALAFLAAHEEALGEFIAVSGIGPQELRQNLTSPEFQAGVIDFLLADENLLISFCEEIEALPHLIWEVRHELPGGAYVS